MKTQLFIENQEVELTDDVQFLLNKQFEDITNPTVIINDWSKTISIPFTEANNRLFGYIYRPDRIIISDGTEDSYKLMEMYFDPTKKLEFRLIYNSFLMMSGYAKMNDIKQTAGKGVYNITLFGQLGKVFQEINKITFDKSTDASNYVIKGEDYVAEFINKDLVVNSWMSAGQLREKVHKKTDSIYNVTDIIGFAPNNSFVADNFDYNTFYAGANISKQFDEFLDDNGFEASTGISANVVIPNGFLPREIGEYRSYLQLPFIYWNKLFQIFQEKAEEITGYEFELDYNWFNVANPYWYNLVYMLKPFNLKKGNEVPNIYTGTSNTAEFQWSKNQGQLPYSTVQNSSINLSIVSEKTPRLEDNKIRVDLTDNINITTHTIDFYVTGEMNHAHDILFTKDNVFELKLVFTGQNGYTWSKTVGVYRTSSTNTDVTNEISTITNNDGYVWGIEDASRYGTQFSSITSSSQWGWHIAVGGENLVKIDKYTFGDWVEVGISANWLNNHTVFGAGQGSSISEFCWLSNVNIYLNLDIQEKVFNSNSYFELNDLWNNEYNLFNEILKYCKMYRLIVTVDDINKKIKFEPITKYFANYRIKDWTDYIDKSKDFVIKPITFENKYVLFNYKDSETKLGKNYKEKYGLNYGEYRLITDYNFNNKKTELFKDIKQAFVNTDNVLSFLNLANHKIVYSFPNETGIDNKDKDKKQVDIFGSFFFHNGLAYWNHEAALRLVWPIKVSDDSLWMKNYSTYFYTFIQQDYELVETYPKLDVVSGDNMCLFNIPKENYTYLNNYSEKNSIYHNFWENYINERYNVQNKLITCYVRFTPEMWNNFEYNQFVKVDNQVCFVNKIYDYDITNTESIKVDLITVQDIAGYNENNYVANQLWISTNEITIPYDYYKRITIMSSGRWQIKADDWNENLVATPTSGAAGTTHILVGTTDEELGGMITFELLDDDDNVIAETTLTVTVGGTGTITVAGDWYTEYTISAFNPLISRNVTSTGGDWRIIKVSNNNGVNLIYTPELYATGNSTISYSVTSSSSPTGIVDFYVSNDAGDITSFRVNFKN